MQLDLFGQWVINHIVGNTPQRVPARMRYAVNVLDKVDLDTAKLAKRKNLTILSFVSEDPIEIEFTPAEAKFAVGMLVQGASLVGDDGGDEWSGTLLRHLVPLWDEMYPQWAEFLKEKKEEESE